jgi:RNA polymerase sigma-70 factor (ECF subfamily)
MDGAPNDSARTSVFERHRGLLFSIAYRMLGSVADAEDALQDAFIRWQRASETDVRSPKAFLVTEPGSDVSRIAQVDESVSMAMLLLLERLTPVERAVFLLGEIFDYTHAEIAGMLGISEANCRQLLKRARQHVGTERPRFSASLRQHTALLERFSRAAGSGDMDGLLALLSSDVVMHTDGGGKANALPLPIYGPDKVARASVFGLSKLKTLNPLQRIVEINGEPGIVSYVGGRPQSVFTIDANDGRIRAIYIVTNPEKLSHLPPPPF